MNNVSRPQMLTITGPPSTCTRPVCSHSEAYFMPETYDVDSDNGFSVNTVLVASRKSSSSLLHDHDDCAV